MYIAGALLFTYALAVWQNDFVSLDDGLLITKNIAIPTINFATLWHIFTTYDPELYVPLTLFTYQVTHLFFGFNPIPYHLGNVLLHFGSSIAILLILERLTQKRFVAFVCALLFALHPLNTEAVMWAAARKDVLASFFGLLSLLCLIRGSDGEERFTWNAAAILFALGLLSKVSIVTMPVAFLVLEWLRGRLNLQLLRQLIPHWVLCIIFGVIALIGKTRVIGSSDPTETALLIARSTLFYFEKIFFPFGLAVVYPAERPILPTQPLIAFSIAFVVLLILGAWFSRKRYPAITAAIVLWGLFLLPNETNFSKNGFLFFASDRYAYLAAISILAIIAVVLTSTTELAKERWRFFIQGILVFSLTVVLGGISFVQANTWKNSETMYENVLRFYPNSALALNNMGNYWMKAGRKEEAEAAFKKALALDPGQMSANINMGNLERERANIEASEKHYRTAMETIEKKDFVNLDELAPYYFLGRLYDEKGEREKAVDYFMKAVEKAPHYAEPRYNLGVQLEKMGRKAEAAEKFFEAIERSPNYMDARYHLSAILAEQGRLPEAIEQLEAIVRVVPNYEKASEHLRQMKALIGT